jgi:hypothetical protein
MRLRVGEMGKVHILVLPIRRAFPITKPVCKNYRLGYPYADSGLVERIERMEELRGFFTIDQVLIFCDFSWFRHWLHKT